MATERQIAANQANAQLSTGPTTEAGKARARFNALRDGLNARMSVLPGESEEEFQALRDGVMAALEPRGVLELMLASRLVTLLWRQRRGLAAEQRIYDGLAGEPGARTLLALGCVPDGEAAAETAGEAVRLAGALDHLSRWEDRIDRAIRHTHRMFEREEKRQLGLDAYTRHDLD